MDTLGTVTCPGEMRTTVPLIASAILEQGASTLNTALAALALAQEIMCPSFSLTALASRAAPVMVILLSLTTMDVASFAMRRVSGVLSISPTTSFSLLSPALDVELPEEERSSGERRGDRRGNQPLTLLFTVAVV
jgi:hypothetical protein